MSVEKTVWKYLHAVVLCLVLSFAAGSLHAAAMERMMTAAVVCLEVVAVTPDNGRLRKQMGSGSGVLISADGFIVTNCHVVRQPVRVTAWLADGRKRKARVVGTDPATDLAVLQLIGEPEDVLLKDPSVDLIVLQADPDAWQKASGDKLEAVDLANGGEAELLDNVLALAISGPTLGRETMAISTGVMIKSTKPRVVYRPSFAIKGGPAFLLDGKLLGIAAQHVYREKLVSDVVIIPAAEVADVVRQALAAKEPASKPAAP